MSKPLSPTGPGKGETPPPKRLSVKYDGRIYSIVTKRSETDDVLKALALRSLFAASDHNLKFTTLVTTLNHKCDKLNIQTELRGSK